MRRGLTSREDRSDEQCVHKVRETTNAQVLHGNDVWRSSSSTAVCAIGEDIDEGWVVVRDQDTDGERANNEEETESPVDRLEGLLDVDAWALRLSGHHGDIFRTNNAERCRPKTREEALKPAQIASGKIFCERTWLFPVAETESIALGVAANHSDESEGEEQEDQDDFASGKPEFGFTVELDSENVQESVEDDRDGDDGASWDIVAPEA